MKTLLVIGTIGILVSAIIDAAPISVCSPNGKVDTTFEIKDGNLFYSIFMDKEAMVTESKIEIIPGSATKVVDQTTRENDTSWKPVYGQFSQIRDHHRELTLSLTADGIPIKLQCRAFDNGVGFRFLLSEGSRGKKTSFTNEYKPVDPAENYSHGGERGAKGPTTLSGQKRFEVPLVTKRADERVMAFLESDLYSATGFESMKIVSEQDGATVTASSDALSLGHGHTTAWRVILLGENFGDLMVNTVALNLSAPCQLEDTGWIKPGKGLWDWRIHGYDNGEFIYGIDTRSYLRLIDFAAEHGLEYLTVDDHWFLTAENGEMEISPKVDIAKVMNYAKEKGIDIMLYYDRKKGNYGDDKLFNYYAGLGAKGMKYGFMSNRAGFTRNAINASAENKILINFHDGPTPMTGVERTMPNLITREYCHAQQDSRRAFTPSSFLKMAMVSALVGPLDQANGNFGINSINAGERQKGPRKKNSYISTVVSEVARTLVIYTGLITLPDAPEEYLKKADLFQYLKEMPATWDDTQVIHATFSEYTTIARRTGETWFVGTVNNEEARTLDIPLNFLKPDTKYSATLYLDAPNAHGLKNPESYKVKNIPVTKGDVITAKMAVGGGHAMIIRPSK